MRPCPPRGSGRCRRRCARPGPGHYVADTLQLVPGGDWKLTVHDRVSAFDEYTATLKVPVR